MATPSPRGQLPNYNTSLVSKPHTSTPFLSCCCSLPTVQNLLQSESASQPPECREPLFLGASGCVPMSRHSGSPCHRTWALSEQMHAKHLNLKWDITFAKNVIYYLTDANYTKGWDAAVHHKWPNTGCCWLPGLLPPIFILLTDGLLSLRQMSSTWLNATLSLDMFH